MKAFEKRIEEIRINAAKNKTQLTGEDWGELQLHENYKHGFKQGWKAVLEWVLGEHGPLDERVNNCDCARGRIRKELEGD